MAIVKQILKYNDPRTNKNYAVQVYSPESAELGMKSIIEISEHDYQKSLPVEKRAVANRSDDFNCPFCKEKTNVSIRKETVTSGFFLFISTEIIDIFKCQKCLNEFREWELRKAKEEVRISNWRAMCLERNRDGEITDEVLHKLLK